MLSRVTTARIVEIGVEKGDLEMPFAEKTVRIGNVFSQLPHLKRTKTSKYNRNN